MNETAELKETRTSQAQAQLEQLKRFTKIVADTGDFAQLAKFQPQDATTNPSLILKAAQMPEYRELVDRAIQDIKDSNLAAEARISAIIEDLLVSFGTE